MLPAILIVSSFTFCLLLDMSPITLQPVPLLAINAQLTNYLRFKAYYF